MMRTKQQEQAAEYVAGGKATSFQEALVNFLDEAGPAYQKIIMAHWGHLIEDMAYKYEEVTMMQLAVEAMDIARGRGHSMESHSNVPLSSGRKQRTYLCANGNCCGYVQIMSDPAPNQVDIGGTSVAMGCPVGDEYHWDITKRVETESWSDMQRKCNG